MKSSSVYACLSGVFACLAPATEVQDKLSVAGHQVPNLSCADCLTPCLLKSTKISKGKTQSRNSLVNKMPKVNETLATAKVVSVALQLNFGIDWQVFNA